MPLTGDLCSAIWGAPCRISPLQCQGHGRLGLRERTRGLHRPTGIQGVAVTTTLQFPSLFQNDSEPAKAVVRPPVSGDPSDGGKFLVASKTLYWRSPGCVAGIIRRWAQSPHY